MAASIGIDLGTTKSCVAVFDDHGPTVVRNAEGDRTTPSCVAMSNVDQPVAGLAAARQAATNPGGTITSVNRLLGRKRTEIPSEEQAARYRITTGDGGDAMVEVAGRRLSPPEICAVILRKLKVAAEAHLGETVRQAVMTVPASFNHDQRKAAIEACRMAGLEVKRLMSAPTAAALAYGFNRAVEQTILVLDVGGGTVDASVIEIGDGVFEVLATAGDGHLGGDDFDRVIVDWLVDRVKISDRVDVSSDPAAMQRLYEAAERAKAELSSVEETELTVPYLAARGDGPVHLTARLTRALLNELSATLLERVARPLRQALHDAKRSDRPVDELLLVGGMTRMPALQAKAREVTGLTPQRGVDADEAVAMGAAIESGIIRKELDGIVLEVTPLTLGIEAEGGTVTKLIARNKAIPFGTHQVVSTTVAGQTSIEVHVVQGEGIMITENKSLGRIQITGIAPAIPGGAATDVRFEIDPDGLISVSAKDPKTGAPQNVRGMAGSTLCDSDCR